MRDSGARSPVGRNRDPRPSARPDPALPLPGGGACAGPYLPVASCLIGETEPIAMLRSGCPRVPRDKHQDTACMGKCQGR